MISYVAGKLVWRDREISMCGVWELRGDDDGGGGGEAAEHAYQLREHENQLLPTSDE